MIHQEISDSLNKQMNKELFSAYFYFDISNFYSEEGLNGFENWFYIQAQEEYDHAQLIRTYLLNNDSSIHLEAIPAPVRSYSDFKTPLTVTLNHEKTITASINDLYSKAFSHKDFRTMQFLDWFVKEQGEEEKSTNDIIKRFDLFGKDSKGLYLLDSELGTRVYSAPTLVL